MRTLIGSAMETIPEMAAEAGFGLAGGVLFFLVGTPTGRRWLRTGGTGCARGVAMAGGAIGSLFSDLRTGWTELIQEVQQRPSAGVRQQPSQAGGEPS